MYIRPELWMRWQAQGGCPAAFIFKSSESGRVQLGIQNTKTMERRSHPAIYRPNPCNRSPAAIGNVTLSGTVRSIRAITFLVGLLVVTGAAENTTALDYRGVIFKKIARMVQTTATQRRIVANGIKTGHCPIKIDTLQPN